LRRVDALPLVISSGWAAGVNAYATVLLLGVFGRLGLGDVPDGLESPGVMIAAAALYAVEFVTDKIPYVDNLWDTVHTAIRPTIAAVLGVLLAGDATGLEPDPISTANDSLDENLLVGTVIALVVTHPWAALALSLTLLALGLTLIALLWRAIRARSAGSSARSSRSS
jgi:Domain of unknown function (DUF4126)